MTEVQTSFEPFCTQSSFFLRQLEWLESHADAPVLGLAALAPREFVGWGIVLAMGGPCIEQLADPGDRRTLVPFRWCRGRNVGHHMGALLTERSIAEKLAAPRIELKPSKMDRVEQAIGYTWPGNANTPGRVRNDIPNIRNALLVPCHQPLSNQR